MPDSLVQSLFAGPVDVVGDVHGEIDALRELLGQLGYDADGRHPQQRRLVFVGDLADRGPDSSAVIDLVEQLVRSERAQCVLGNHDLNILLDHRKHDNHWFFGESWALDGSEHPTPAILADQTIRQRVCAFFRSLPLALERDGLRIVHACWDDAMVDVARQSDDVLDLYEQSRQRIETRLVGSSLDDIDRGLQHQNQNPVRVLTSGLETRVDTPYEASGKVRYETRVPWWQDYTARELCVFGHYASYDGEPRASGRTICIDYAVGKRWMERRDPGFCGRFRARLAAVRIPEMNRVFDDGEGECLEDADL